MRICMLAYTFYETDNRVKRYAEALANRGDDVDVISLRQEGQSAHDIHKGVNIYRIQKRTFNEKGKLSYLYRLSKFFIRSSFFLTKRHLKSPYDLIHVHSVPDFEVFATWLAKLTGSKIILDIHDIVPEFYVSKFNTNKDSIIFKMLTFIEKASIAFSDHVIVSNHLWEKTLCSRSVNKEKCSVILNYPDPSIFYYHNRNNNHDKFIILYPGTLAWHQGLDIAIKAFALIKDQIPESEFHIYGDGSERKALTTLINDMGLEKRVSLKGLLSLEEIASVMADSDLGIVPKRGNSFGNEAFSTKILEFMALGIPVIIADTKIDRFYFDESIVRFFKSEDIEELAKEMVTMIKNRDLRNSYREKASKFIEENNWGKKKVEYFTLINTLVGSRKRKRLVSSL